MEKKELRQKYKALRAALTNDEIADKSVAIANNLLQINVWDKTYFHLFLTMEKKKGSTNRPYSAYTVGARQGNHRF